MGSCNSKTSQTSQIYFKSQNQLQPDHDTKNKENEADELKKTPMPQYDCR